MDKLFLLIVFFLSSISSVTSQFNISGVVKDNDMKNPIFGALIYFENSNLNVESDEDGVFLIKDVDPGEHIVSIYVLGYKTVKRIIKVDSDIDLGNIFLNSIQIGLEEIQVISSDAYGRSTPVAISAIKKKEIEASLGTKEIVELVNNTPNVYATKGSGGFGDSRINIRGFDQSNIAVLINGIPVNDMENGWVFWSNLSGLGDAIQSIQVQRGLGASKLAISSVGGTMNILTKTAEVRKGMSLTQELSSYNTSKSTISMNTGQLKNKWAISFVGSRTQGQGYVDGTFIDAWSYYLSAYKTFNAKHSIQITLLGSPQRHGQRDNSIFGAQSFEENTNLGSKHNKNWGNWNGSFKSNRINFYHKPQLSLNHYWTKSDKTFIATSIYLSQGRGGGIIHQGRIVNDDINFQNTLNLSNDNQIDWNQVYAVNDTSSIGSNAILRASRHNHFWAGLLSVLKYDVRPNIKLSTGLDFRYFVGEHYEKIDDLLGGLYWYDFINNTAQVGDRINYDFLAKLTYGGVFSQIEYQKNKISSYLNVAVSNTFYGRKERFYVDFGDVIGKPQSIFGYNLKVGGSYQLNKSNTFFINSGYYSRAPFHSFVFINFSNQVNPNILNEKVLGLEFGYKYKIRDKFMANVNVYSTTWLDKWVNNEVSYQPQGTNSPDDILRSRANFNIPKELHRGIEFDFKYNINRHWLVNGFGTVGNWEYKENTDVVIREEFSSVVLDTMDLYIKGLKVANQPQSSIGFGVSYRKSQFDFTTNYRFFSQIYAQFNEADSNDSNNINQSYKLPSYGILDGRLAFRFKLGKANIKAFIQGYNLLNVETPYEGFDSAQRDTNGDFGHGKENFKGFWTRGINFNFGLKVKV